MTDPAIQSANDKYRRKHTCGGRILWVLSPLLLALVFLIVPNPPTPSGFVSGGLGQTRNEWEQLHKKTDEGRPMGFLGSWITGYTVYDRHLYVWFWPEGWLSQGEARISAIENNGSLTRDEARYRAQSLMPNDAQLQQTGHIGDSYYYEVYQSNSLATRFPRRYLSFDPWAGTVPGTIYVFYGDEPVLSFTVRIPAGGYGWTPAQQEQP